MPEYTYNRVYNFSEVNWDTTLPTNNGVLPGTTFTVTGRGHELTLLDDDPILEDNTNSPNGTNYQTRDDSQQTLVHDFGDNEAGDYVWSRAYQEIRDEAGNIGRIYQIRISDWQPGNPNYPDNVSDMHTYYAFSGPIEFTPGTVFTVTGSFDGFGNQAHATFGQATCFGADALIETAKGPVAAGDLTVGTLVATRDAGLQPVRWIGRRVVGRDEMRAAPGLRPIRIRAGALGQGMPSRDLLVSPQHRVLVRSKIAQRLFDATEILVAAKQLLALEGVEVAEDIDEVTYVHFMFDAHEIVRANGAETESLFAGEQTLRMIGPKALDELFTLFPQLRNPASPPQPARPLIEGKMARKLASRHARNGMDLVSDAVLN